MESFIWGILSQPDAEYIHRQRGGASIKEPIHPKTSDALADAREDLLAFTSLLRADWRPTWSTNKLKRLTREMKSRTDVVGGFPNPEALPRLTTAVLMEQHDDWAASNRRCPLS